MWFRHGWWASLISGVTLFWFDVISPLIWSSALSVEEYKLVIGHRGGGDTDSLKLLSDEFESEHLLSKFGDASYPGFWVLYSSLISSVCLKLSSLFGMKLFCY